MITDLAYDTIMSSAYNLQLSKSFMLINFIISIVQMNKLTFKVCNNPEKKKLRPKHRPSQLLILSLFNSLRLTFFLLFPFVLSTFSAQLKYSTILQWKTKSTIFRSSLWGISSNNLTIVNENPAKKQVPESNFCLWIKWQICAVILKCCFSIWLLKTVTHTLSHTKLEKEQFLSHLCRQNGIFLM